MLHFKAPGFCINADFVTADWGVFVRYVEVADDYLAARQVEVFDNGSVLRYDRAHWCDDFGMLLAHKFSHKPKWKVFFPGAELITSSEFKKLWRRSQSSQLHEEQVNRSRVDLWGTFRVG